MFIQLSDPSLTRALVRYLHARQYLALAYEEGLVEAAPINAVSAQGDRARLTSDLYAWRSEHVDVQAELLHDCGRVSFLQ